MTWRDLVDRFDAGQLARMEMLASLKRHVYFHPEDEEDVLRCICHHADPDVSSYGAELKRWIDEAREIKPPPP